jgi:hypothetical protein
MYTLHRFLRYGFDAEYIALLPLIAELADSVYSLFPIIYGATLLDQ